MATKEDADVTFVSNLSVHGFNNGVVNLVFQTAQWLPVQKDNETVVVTGDFISANLRMDLFVATQVRDALNLILEANTHPPKMDS